MANPLGRDIEKGEVVVLKEELFMPKYQNIFDISVGETYKVQSPCPECGKVAVPETDVRVVNAHTGKSHEYCEHCFTVKE